MMSIYFRAITLMICAWFFSNPAGAIDNLPQTTYNAFYNEIRLTTGDSLFQYPVRITKPGTGFLVCSQAGAVGTPAHETVSFFGGTATSDGARSYTNSGVTFASLALRGISQSGFGILICGVWSGENREYISDSTILGGDFYLLPKPIITVPTTPVDLGVCFVGSNEKMRGDFSVQTSWAGTPDDNAEKNLVSATLSATLLTGPTFAGGALQILDENNNDLLKRPSSISTGSNGSHILTAEVTCPPEAGEYQWTVSLLYEIK
nr:hypothetical protein [uncultured Pantoea sp.]